MGPPLMGAGAIGEQTRLLLLDAVLHLATGTVDLVVELPGIAVEIGDDKAWVAPLCGDFEPGDHHTAASPRPGAIAQVNKVPLFLSRCLEALFNLGKVCLDQSL